MIKPQESIATAVPHNENDIVEPKPIVPVAASENATTAAGSKSISIISEPASAGVSAFSLASIRAKKELQKEKDSLAVEEIHLPKESFSETEMQYQWIKYANRLGDKGQKIMESLLLINDPKLEGTLIIHELPNESSKHDFESEKRELLGYLRGMLKNHDIDIKLVVNESIDSKKAFTAQDRYNRLNELNPNLEKFKKLFDLDF